MIEIKGTVYCYEKSLQGSIEKLAQRVYELRRQGKLTPEVLGNLRQYFRVWKKCNGIIEKLFSTSG